MISNDLKTLLSELKETKPNKDWAASARADLINHIDNSASVLRESEAVSRNSAGSSAGASWFERTLAQPKWAGAFTLGIFAIMIISASVAQNSVPGDSLYGVKIASENLRTAVTFDEMQNTALRAEYAERRVNEVSSLALSTLNEEEAASVEDLLENYKREIDEARTSGSEEVIEQKIAEVTERTKTVDELIRIKTNQEPETNDTNEKLLATISELTAGCSDEVLLEEIDELVESGQIPAWIRALELASACGTADNEGEPEDGEDTDTGTSDQEAGEFEQGESE